MAKKKYNLLIILIIILFIIGIISLNKQEKFTNLKEKFEITKEQNSCKISR